jgi:hypothetical protein
VFLRLYTYDVYPQTHYINQSAPISTYDAQEVFGLLKYCDRELTFPPSFLNSEARHLSKKPRNLNLEPQERIMTVSNVTDRLGLTEADTKVFADVDWKEQQATVS